MKKEWKRDPDFGREYICTEMDRDRKIFGGREKKRMGLGNRQFEPVLVGLCFQKAENVLLCIERMRQI